MYPGLVPVAQTLICLLLGGGGGIVSIPFMVALFRLGRIFRPIPSILGVSWLMGMHIVPGIEVNASMHPGVCVLSAVLYPPLLFLFVVLARLCGSV